MITLRRFIIMVLLLVSVTISGLQGQKQGVSALETSLYTVTSKRLNVRQQPSTRSNKVGFFRKGDVVEVVSIENGWANIIVGENEAAYVYARYLVPVNVAEENRIVKTQTTQPTQTMSNVSDFSRAFFDVQNAYRVQNGIPALIWNDSAYNACVTRASEISTVFSHNRPSGDLRTLMNDNNIKWHAVGENIGKTNQCAYGDANYILSIFKASPSHNAGMLDTTYTSGAVCIVEVNGIFYISCLFIG